MDTLREAGVELIVPLIGQGELLGALYLGPRLSDQPYSTDDRRLLGSLASQVAPAMKVAQLVRRAAGRGQGAGADPPGAPGRGPHPADPAAQGIAGDCRLAGRRLLSAGAGSGRRLLRLHRPRRRPARCGHRRRHRQRRAGRTGHGHLSIDAAGRSPASQLSVGGPGRRQRWPGAGDPARHVRDLSLRNHRYRGRGDRVRQRRSQPSLRADTTTVSSS